VIEGQAFNHNKHTSYEFIRWFVAKHLLVPIADLLPTATDASMTAIAATTRMRVRGAIIATAVSLS